MNLLPAKNGHSHAARLITAQTFRLLSPMLSITPKTASGWLACIGGGVGVSSAVILSILLHERSILQAASAHSAIAGTGVVRHTVLKDIPSRRHAVAQLWNQSGVVYECYLRSPECRDALPKDLIGKDATVFISEGKVVKTVVDGFTTDTKAKLIKVNISTIKFTSVLLFVAAVLIAMAYWMRINERSR
ncbi:hypothetical protein GN316_15185 [Xylophilus sp. Kf1]|nr:hypothetical protein [Xylophilus sp. Kf1]